VIANSCVFRLVLGDGQGGQRRLHRQHTVLAQGALDVLGVGALGQQELAVVLPVHALAVRLLLVLGVNLQKITNWR
jgi:hypothetical protein